jgi:hypothetical protein
MSADFFLLLAGPLAGGVFAWLVFLRYRNTNKTNQYEKEAAVAAEPIQASDTKMRTVLATRDATTSGRNEHSHRQRVTRD